MTTRKAKRRKRNITEEINQENEDKNESDINLAKLCSQLNQHNDEHFYGYEDELSNVKSIIADTIENGKCNSILICGARGCGKTTLLERCLTESKLTKHTHIVRLNALVDGNDVSSLKHVASIVGIDSSSDISAIVSQLKQIASKQVHFRVIIILDEFDVFCRRNQTLLYNLFDFALSSKSVCIIGVSSRLDCIELLEKRVKSRMGQRIIHLSSPFKDFNHYLTFSRSLLEPNGIKLNDQLKQVLQRQFALNKCVRDLKQVLLEYLITKHHNNESTTTVAFQKVDNKLSCLLSLSTYELCVIVSSWKYTQHQNQTTFNIAAIMDSLRTFSKMTNISKSMLFKLVYNLIDIGLIEMLPTGKKNDSYMSEWTMLSLNVDELHIREVIKQNEHLLPINVKQILMN